MADKSRLTKSRAVYRGQITKLQNRIRDILASEVISVDDHDSVIASMDLFQEKLATVLDFDKQISDIVDEDNLEIFLTEADDYTTQVREAFIKYERQLNRRVAPPADSIPSIPDQTHTPPNLRTQRHVNLPKLTLAQFDGDILQWSSFYDSFESAIGLDTGLTNVQKFHYLRAQLTGEAGRVIAGLSLTDSNFTHAIELLKSRYGQKHQIINAYMRALWQLNQPDYTLDSLRHFYDSLESHIRGLSALGKTVDTYGDLLVPVILDKLPAGVRKQIARQHEDTEWSIDNLRSSLSREIKVLQAGGECPSISNDDRFNATAAFHTSASSRQPAFHNNKQSKCAFCKGNHSPNECTIITDRRKRHDVVVRDKLCYNCLGRHRAADCKSHFRCRVCTRKHHTSLCSESSRKSVTASGFKDSSIKAGIRENKSDFEETKVTLATSNGPVLLKTAIATVSASSNETTAVILFDEGAQRSFITQETVELLNLKCEETENVQLSVFGKRSGTQSLPVARFQLHTETGSETMAICALVVPRISTPMRNYVNRSVVNLPHIRGLKLAHPSSCASEHVISILIGADFYWSIVGDHIVRGPGPTAVSSKLGYLLSGPTAATHQHNHGKHTSVYHISVDIDSHQQEVFDLQRFWDLESIGVGNNELESVSKYTDYRDTHIREEQGHYIAKLPWKADHAPLPTNHQLTEKRTRSMVRRLTPEVREAYDSVIKEQLSQAYIDSVPNDDTTTGHYLPHRAVIKESSSTPLRIVYDCSASQNNTPSLNDCLQTGTPLLNDLVSMLLRFRIHKVAFTADIHKAFLQIGLDHSERKYTKFFWLSDYQDPESEFITYQFQVILFGAVCSPFILNSTVRSHLDAHPSDVTQDLINNIYVDNIVTGCDDELSAIKYYDETNETMNSGGFQLQQWSTNSSDVRGYIEPDGLFESKREVNVLGIKWDTESDRLSFRETSAVVSEEDTLTKRKVLQMVAKIFDPLGLLAPIQVRAKLFIQKLWKSGYSWDEPLSNELVLEWKDIVDDISLATATAIDRRYFNLSSADESTYELHVFADASKAAYGCTIYLRDIQHEQTTFVMAKSRIAPIKELTIPQLELLAVVIACNLLQFVLKSVGKLLIITKTILWTDSQIVLHWINSDKKLTTFVTNRLKVIRSSQINEFKFCSTRDNPADLVTRGISFNDFSQSTIWWNGPNWLEKGDWPICHVFDSAVLTLGAETVDILPDQNVAIPNQTKSFAINSEHFSSRAKLHRVTAYVLRFVRAIKDKERASTQHLSTSEISEAERFWITNVQHQHYTREVEALQEDGNTRCPRVKQLHLFLDGKGFLRVGGRLHNAPVKYETRFPILLPPDAHYTRLLILDAHREAQHGGTETTMTSLRQHYWITRMRRTVRSVLAQCVPCKKLTGLPYRLPDAPPLQSCRLLEAPPFTVCGLDFTGAMYVKSSINGSPDNKAYILLFTCASTRAVHLEVVPNLSVYTFLLAFRRFASRRSLPTKLLSDNASTFLSAGEEIKKIFNSDEVREYMLNHRIEWSNITKRAPWQGGFWERLIGITKTALKKVLGRAFVTYDELATVITEVETAINNRPLTYLSADVNDPSPLTPSHLLHGRMIVNLPYPTISDDEIRDPTFGNSRIDLERRTMYLGSLLTHFWQRWRNEYVTALRERHINSHHKTRGSSDLIKVGDVVQVHDDGSSRLKWKLGLVTQLVYGNDNQARSAQIKMQNMITNRPINKLYPLEVSSETIPDIQHIVDDNSNGHNSTQRTPRKAALAAKEMIKIIAENN